MSASQFGSTGTISSATRDETSELEQAAASAEEAKEHVQGAIKSAAHRTLERAESATGAVGDRLRSAGEAVREKGDRTTEAIAHSLESTGQYLQEEGISGAANDLTVLIRRHPIPALFLGLGIGYLVAQAARRG
jgi:hypothetical protein